MSRKPAVEEADSRPPSEDGAGPVLPDLAECHFDDSFLRSLPGDPERRVMPRQVRNALYTEVEPTPVSAPRLLVWSDEVGELLGVRPPEDDRGEAVQALAGNCLLPGMRPYASRYGGHQFGHWAGQLGDGRALTLGERVNAAGQRWELQLKGAGPTPYSRGADGRAVLRSSLREFLCSEAMHHLGIPTTRALSLVATGDSVVRDMFYDGHPRAEPGAVVCRVAPSFIRFGHFELPASLGETGLLAPLADYVIAEHDADLTDLPDRHARWFERIARRTAVMVAHWMRVGFVHGVMNTDNMSVLGLTIDYGPYGWLEDYDPAWTPNTTDAQGRRYCYGNQPQIAYWNLGRLARALHSLAPEEALQQGLATYRVTFEASYRRMLADKLGLAALDQPGDDQLLEELFQALAERETDFSLFFRLLARLPEQGGEDADLLDALEPALYQLPQPVRQPRLLAWLRARQRRLRDDPLTPQQRRHVMDRANPVYVMRNYLAQVAIDAAEAGDLAPLQRLMQAMRTPYEEQPGLEDLTRRRPEWARHRPGCSALSCSS